MHLTYLIRSRVWVVPVALAILGFCLTIFVCLSGRRKNRLDSMNSTDLGLNGLHRVLGID